MANYMKEVANMLGVELYEKFIITCGVSLGQDISHEGPICYLSECGLKCDETKDLFCELYLSYLLSGAYTIKRQPWKPLENHYFWHIGVDGVPCSTVWVHATSDTLLYKLGNCYRTKEEAEENRDKWIKFYESNEVLDI